MRLHNAQAGDFLLQGAVDFAYFQPRLRISRGAEAAINPVASATTGTALNAVSAVSGSSQNMAAAMANIVTRAGGCTGKAVLQKAGERVHIYGHAGQT